MRIIFLRKKERAERADYSFYIDISGGIEVLNEFKKGFKTMQIISNYKFIKKLQKEMQTGPSFFTEFLLSILAVFCMWVMLWIIL